MKDYKMYKQIFSLRLAGYLMMNGFRIMRIHHNLKHKDKDIYLFEDSKELSDAMIKYSEIKCSKEMHHDTNERS